MLFEDFGDSAQMLTLYFWVEVSDKVSATQVASDLRFMIDKRLAEDGIVIAFPAARRPRGSLAPDTDGDDRRRGATRSASVAPRP